MNVITQCFDMTVFHPRKPVSISKIITETKVATALERVLMTRAFQIGLQQSHIEVFE